jgi:hypothetical protein
VIADHAWRPVWATGPAVSDIPTADRPCAYANCGRPRTEHERARSLSKTPATDWSRYQKCSKCGAPLGKPCRSLTGAIVHGRPYPQVDPVTSEAASPHGGRKLRAGASRG